MARLNGVGLSLSAGGIAGVGAISGFAAAWDMFLASHSITDFEAFTGVSAGAILASFYAAGLPPGVVASTLIRRKVLPPGFEPISWEVYLPNLAEALKVPRRFGAAIRDAVSGVAGRGGAGETADEVLSSILPSSVLSNRGIRRWIRRALERFATTDFRTIGRRLTVSYHDLLRNERIVCGYGGREDVPIDEAVAASAAIPGVYPPQRIMIDGEPTLGVDGATAGVGLDVKVIEDLDVLIVYNAMSYPRLADGHASALKVLYLAGKLLFNQRNREEAVAAMNSFPGKHVLYDEPGDPFLLHYNELSYWDGIAAFGAAFRETARKLAAERDYHAFVFGERGVKLNPGIDSLDPERVLDDPLGVKEEIRRRHAPDAPPVTVGRREGAPASERRRPSRADIVTSQVVLPIATRGAPKEGGNGRPIPVLVVDDEPDFVDTVMDFLEGPRFAVDSARDPDEALAVLEKREAAVALVDLQMPAGGGERLLKELQGRFPLCQPIVVTAYGSESKAVSVLREKGAVNYLSKGRFDEDSLVRAIEAAARDREGAIVSGEGGFAVIDRYPAAARAVVLTLAGHLVADTHFARMKLLERAIEGELARGMRHILLDLRLLRSVVPLALGRTLPAARVLEARGGFVGLVRPARDALPVVQAFMSAGMSWLRIFVEMADALAAVKSATEGTAPPAPAAPAARGAEARL